MGLRSGRS